jgi:hypothetical protein
MLNGAVSLSPRRHIWVVRTLNRTRDPVRWDGIDHDADVLPCTCKSGCNYCEAVPKVRRINMAVGCFVIVVRTYVEAGVARLGDVDMEEEGASVCAFGCFFFPLVGQLALALF